jgi:hypothetical protein
VTTDIITKFDYTALSPEIRVSLKARAEKIGERNRRIASDIWENGRDLHEAQQELAAYGYGTFQAWIEQELNCSKRLAYRMINAYKKLEGLGDATEVPDNIGISALYVLSEPSAPYAALETAVRLARGGECITRGRAYALLTNPTDSALTRLAESDLTQAFCEHLAAIGIDYQTEVHCGFGRADIVTPEAIYEVKFPISRTNFFHAVGQVVLYRAGINPDARAVILTVHPEGDDFQMFIDAAEKAGVEVELWPI